MYAEGNDDLDDSPDELDFLSSPPKRPPPSTNHTTPRPGSARLSRKQEDPSPASSPVKRVVIPIKEYEEKFRTPVVKQTPRRQSSSVRQPPSRNSRGGSRKAVSTRRSSSPRRPFSTQSKVLSLASSGADAAKIIRLSSPSKSPPSHQAEEAKEGTEARRQLLDQILQSFYTQSPEDHPIDDQVSGGENSPISTAQPKLADSSSFDLADEFDSDTVMEKSDHGKGEPGGSPDVAQIETSSIDAYEPSRGVSVIAADKPSTSASLDTSKDSLVNLEDRIDSAAGIPDSHPSNNKSLESDPAPRESLSDAQKVTAVELSGAAHLPTPPPTNEQSSGQQHPFQLSDQSLSSRNPHMATTSPSTPAEVTSRSAPQATPDQAPSPGAATKLEHDINGPPSATRTEDIEMSTPFADTGAEGEDEIDAEDVALAGDDDGMMPPASLLAAATPSESMASTPGPQADAAPQPKAKGAAKKSKDSKSTLVKKAAKPASASQAVKVAGKKVAGKSKTKSKPDQKAPRCTSQVESVPPGTASVVSAELPASFEEGAESGTDDERIFCVCKRRYKEEEEDTTMIGCEGGCENWYHPQCVGLKDEQVEAIGTYICKECELRTGRKTTWTMMACKREGCNNSTANKGSKFCSHACAFRHAQSLIPAVANKKQLKQLHDAFVAYPQPGPEVSVMKHDRSAIDAKSGSSTNPKADISAQLKIVQSALEMVQKRQRILSQAIARWESSGSGAANGAAADGEHADAPPLSKKSKKHQSKDKEERLCGWDERLVWDDTEVVIWSGEQWEGDTCVKGRRCDRHQGWQKTIGASLQVEEALLTRRSQDLAAQKDQLERYGEAQAVAQQIRENMRARLAVVK